MKIDHVDKSTVAVYEARFSLSLCNRVNGPLDKMVASGTQ
jgi:hypothetical protein